MLRKAPSRIRTFGFAVEPSRCSTDEEFPVSDESRTILLVDDDSDTRGSILRVLQKKGFHVLEADGAVEATEIAHRSGDEIDLVVLDVIMPGMSGISTADKLAEEIGDLRILYISGFIEGELPERHESPGRSAFLQKPFTVGEMFQRIEELLSDLEGEGEGSHDEGDG